MRTLEEFENEADALLLRVHSGEEDARSRFKWEHPLFHGKPIAGVEAAGLTVDDARFVVAREDGFEDWDDLVRFLRACDANPAVPRFEAAADAVITGDFCTLESMIRAHPDLTHARSERRHHATLLHYIGANGVEGWRQKTPANAVEIATLLLDTGSDPEALADMYDARCTTLSMLCSSTPPHDAGQQLALAELLLDRGAKLVGPGSNWQSAVLTALQFGFLDTAQALAARAEKIDDLATAAGLGRADDVKKLLPKATPARRHAAVALAAQHGQVEPLKSLLDAGEDPNRFNPDGYHSHSTPLHQAVWAGHEDAVRLLVERGARMDIWDAVYLGTPIDWALHAQRPQLADYLRESWNVNPSPEPDVN